MEIIVNARARDNTGRGEARRLRRAGEIPAVVYGGGEAPAAVSCAAREIAPHLQDEAFRSTLLNLRLGGKEMSVLVRDVQMHPCRREIVHMDFQVVRADSEITASVPLHFINVEESPGVKLHHGIFSTVENQLGVRCLPKDLPEVINVDVGNLGIGQNIHLSDIAVPAGVRFEAAIRGEDPALAVVSEPRAEAEETPEAAAGDASAAAEGESAESSA